MIKKTTISTGILLLLSYFAVINSSFALNKVFTGKVREVVEQNNSAYIKYSEGFHAYITWIIPPGTYVKGAVYDKNGKIIKKGDLLCIADPSEYKNILENAQGNLEIMQGYLKEAEIKYERTLWLRKKILSLRKNLIKLKLS